LLSTAQLNMICTPLV